MEVKKTNQSSTNYVIFTVGRKYHPKIPLESLKTVEFFSIPRSKPTKMALTPFCVWASYVEH